MILYNLDKVESKDLKIIHNDYNWLSEKFTYCSLYDVGCYMLLIQMVAEGGKSENNEFCKCGESGATMNVRSTSLEAAQRVQ